MKREKEVGRTEGEDREEEEEGGGMQEEKEERRGEEEEDEEKGRNGELKDRRKKGKK